MYENPTIKEIDFYCAIRDPIILKENLFPENFKAPHLWLEEDYKPYKVRNYQMIWQDFSSMFVNDPRLSDQKNFDRQKLAGKCYNIGARGIGKSLDFIQLDTPLKKIYNAGYETCLASATGGFLRKVTNPIVTIEREHLFFHMFKKSGKSEGIQAGNAGLEIQSRNGHTFYGRNEKVDSPDPGNNLHGLHYKHFYYEESHYMSDKGKEKRVDSGLRIGIIERFSGIPDIRLGSPIGEIIGNPKNRKWVCRLPQYVSSDWNESIKKARAHEYRNVTSIAYKLNVEGEIIEGAEGFWDVERIKKKCLNKDRKIKQFDIDKKKFKDFKRRIIIDRLPSNQIFVTADIGMGSRPTEIIVIFNTKKLRYEYNISLNKLTSREQAEVLAYIYEVLGGAFLAVDSTTDYGVIEHLENTFKIPKDHLLAVDLRKSIPIGFEKDDNGKILNDNKGNPIIKSMVAIEWAMILLEDFFYGGKMDIPIDNKFFKEFSDFLCLQSGTRKKFDTRSFDDLHQAFQIFAICYWDKEWKTLTNQKHNPIKWVY